MFQCVLIYLPGSHEGPNVSISLGDYQRSSWNGDDVFCVDHATLTYISNIIICNTKVQGRIITIQSLETNGQKNFFDLCEIEMFGESKYSRQIYLLF